MTSHPTPPRPVLSAGLLLALVAIALVAIPVASGVPSPGSSSAPHGSPAAAGSGDAAASGAPAGTGNPAGSRPPSPTPGSFPSLDAAAWTRVRADGGPSAREDHTWTVDQEGTAAWLFGGRDGGKVHDDLWRFDLATDTWSRLDPAGPRPKARFGHSAAWVPGVGLVIFAGQAGSTFFGDLWAIDPATERWDRLPADGAAPADRYGSCAVLGHDGRFWISHGFTDKGRFDDTRAYDFTRKRWANETPQREGPVIRCLHECFLAADGRLLLFGGQTNGEPALRDFWALGPGGRWEALPDAAPKARRLYAVAEAGGQGWIFGGAGRDDAVLDDLWRVDLDTLEWRPVRPAGDRPGGRSAGTLVADIAGGRLLLFGGQGASARKADLWQLAASPSELSPSTSASAEASPGV